MPEFKFPVTLHRKFRQKYGVIHETQLITGTRISYNMGALKDRVQEVHSRRHFSKSEPFRKLSNEVRGNIFGERVINCKFLLQQSKM
jgi:hypothetical protein